MSSLEICALARETVPAYFPDCQVIAIPVADGGEGTVECFAQAIGADLVTVSASGPYGADLEAVYARKDSTAVIEMASVAGLPLVKGRRNPEKTTTFGVGELIHHAVEHGCRHIILGLGGSATNDGGCGCAAAMGVRFFDREGKEFVPVGETLDQIAGIDVSQARKRLENTTISVMCDVENPLYGPTGAAHVFAPQKGADCSMVERLDGGLRWLDQVIQRELHRSVADIPGAGAAGGMGGGCVAFLDAELKSGIETVLDTVSFDQALDGADLVITGEGRIDAQSVRGKVISGIARRTRAGGVPLVAVVGGIHPSADAAYELGVTAMFSINREAEPLETAAPKSRENYRRTLGDILRLVRAIEGTQ